MKPLPAAERHLDTGVLARRIRSALARWADVDPGARQLVLAVLGQRDRAMLKSFLERGETRTWIAGLEDALTVAEAASAAARVRGTAAATSRAWLTLMDRLALVGELTTAAPSGTLPRDLPRRAQSIARRHLDRRLREIPMLVLPALPREARRGRFRVRFEEDPDIGRPADELWLAGGAIRVLRRPRAPRALTIDLEHDSVRFGSMILTYDTLKTGTAQHGPPAIGAVRRESGMGVRVGRRRPGFEARVAAAFELLDRIWPQAALRVAEQTWLVVPVEEWGTVSYSSPRLPGVTFVNVRSSPMIRLAEDLLHEATHQRLHDIETRGPLVTPLAVEGGDEPRYYSPWRREWRPLRGLLHAACTFTTGARFFERSLAAASSGLGHVCLSGSRTLWLARRLLEEMHDVTIALAALRSAAREELLTPTGRRLASEVRREHRRLAPAAAVARKCLSSSAQGRVEIDRLERHVRRLAKHPFRW